MSCKLREQMWKKIHVELEFLRLKFHCLLSCTPSSLILVSFSPWFFFFGSARDSSSSNLRSPARDSSSPGLRSLERFLDLVLLLLLPIYGSSSSLPSSFVIFFGTRVFKTRVSCGKNLSISTIRTRVFETWFLHRTQASDAQDVIFLISS